LTDIGRVGVAFIGGRVAVAHSDVDSHLRLVTNDTVTWSDRDLTQNDLFRNAQDPVLAQEADRAILWFRDGGSVIEAFDDPLTGWMLTELSAGRATAIHDPRGCVDGDRRHVVYWGDDDDWHLLSHQTDWLGAAVLSEAGLGRSAGQPTVFSVGGLPHVIGRVGGDGHLVEVWPDLAGGWKFLDVTVAAQEADPTVPAATYSVTVAVVAEQVTVVFRAVGGDLWAIDRSTNSTVNATVAAGSVPASGHPSCFVFADSLHVVYRGIDATIYDVARDASGFWTSQPVCGDRAASDPVTATGEFFGAAGFRRSDGMTMSATFDGVSWTCGETVFATSSVPTP
jgi:hypothetical protein